MRSQPIVAFWLGMSFIALASCSSILDDHLNPAYCAAHPQDTGCRTEYPDADLRCTSNEACAAPTGVCELTQGTCVQCTIASHDACVGSTPVCSVDDVCRACASHADCPSSACLPSGACGDDTTVAYVDPSGSGTSCTKAAPCVKVADALKTARPYVKFQGVTNEQISLNGESVTFLADPGAKLSATTNGILLKIDGATQLAIYDLEISGASGANNSGISLQAGNASTIALARVRLTGNAGAGILITGGSATLSECSISENTGAGIAANGGTLAVSRSQVFGNGGGGISASSAIFSITNNFVYRNGNTTSTAVGGIAITGSAISSKLELNTIVDNQANGGSAASGGVLCDLGGFVAGGNLIFRNTGGTSGTAQTFGICGLGNSYVNSGASTVDNTPMFVHPNSPPFDYHLTAASPSSIVDAGGTCSGSDFDNDTRPIGTACDLGADERKP